MKITNGIGRKKFTARFAIVDTTAVLQQPATAGDVQDDADQESEHATEHERERGHVQGLERAAFQNSGPQFDQTIHQRASSRGDLGDVDAFARSSASARSIAALSPRIASVRCPKARPRMSLMPPNTSSKSSPAVGEVEEHLRLRGVAVSEREGDDATLVPFAQHRQLGRRRHALHDRADEALRRGVLRGGEHVEHVALLDHPSALHDRDLGRDGLDDVHLVGDDDDRHALLLVDPLEQVEHLVRGLRVERAGRLVCEQDRGPRGECAGDADALLLTAGELLGVRLRLVGQADERRAARSPAPRCRPSTIRRA